MSEYRLFERQREVESRLRAGSFVLNCAYFAGLFDGEGSIWIRCNGYYALTLVLANTDEAPLLIGQSQWGGKLYVRSRSRSALGSKPLHAWHLQSQVASTFLRDVLPHLIVKKAQAELGLEFQARVDAIRDRKPRSANEIAERERLRNAIRALNRKVA